MSGIAILGAATPWVSQWLTPLWLLGLGALGALVILLALWLLAAVVARIPGLNAFPPVSPRNVTEIPIGLREGVLWPLLIATISLAVFGLVGTVFVQKPSELLQSLKRLPISGTTEYTFQVPVAVPIDPDDEFSELTSEEISVPIVMNEFQRIVFESDQPLIAASEPFLEIRPGSELEIIAGEETAWDTRRSGPNPFLSEDTSIIYVRNTGSAPADLTVSLTIAPPNPEVATIPITALSIVIVFVLYFLQRSFAPRLSAIALSTYKSEIAQPLFALIMCLGLFALWMFIWIPYNTFGEDIKMLKDSGLTLVMILGIVQAVWAASNSVSEEIEGRTALTVLSKPIGRRAFIGGKFLGIGWTVLLLFVLLGLMLLIVVAYKPIHEARESSTADVTWQLCHLEMVQTVPGLLLAFMETIVMASISVAISTRLPLLANIVICFSIYLLGHLTPLIVQSSAGKFEFVQFFGQLIATVFPNLDHFSIQAAVAAGVPVPYTYLWVALAYSAVYSLIAMLLALFLFEDRDLA